MTATSLIKNFIRLIYLVRKTNFSGVTSKECSHLVWAKIWGIKFFSEDEFVHSLAQIHALSARGIKFNIRFNNKIGGYQNKKIFLSYSREIDPFKFHNYAQTIYFVCQQLEDQGCQVHPQSQDVLYWENKGYMTQRFIELGISTPKTILLTNANEISKIDLPYPYLIKEEHSFSSLGLHKIKNQTDLSQFIQQQDYFSKSKYLLVQELLDMRRDLRVILVGDQIVHYYWRINKSEEWKPTSTSHGSGVDFGNFPEQWRSFIVDQFKKLGLTTGAFDIAWRNDDLSTPPLILEVSPNYQPNPALDLKKVKYSYGEYKKILPRLKRFI